MKLALKSALLCQAGHATWNQLVMTCSMTTTKIVKVKLNFSDFEKLRQDEPKNLFKPVVDDAAAQKG